MGLPAFMDKALREGFGELCQHVRKVFGAGYVTCSYG